MLTLLYIIPTFLLVVLLAIVFYIDEALTYALPTDWARHLLLILFVVWLIFVLNYYLVKDIGEDKN